LGEQAYLAIKRMILTGEYVPGQQLNVATLAEQLDLGRSPVHMAIHRLEREGLIAIIPRKGILIKSETLESFLELIAARQLIEPYLAEQALDNLTPETIQRLEALVELGWNHHEAGNRVGGMEVDRQFHQTLYEVSGNRILADFAGQLLDRSMVLWFRAPKSDNQSPNVTELQALLDAIKKRDKTATITLMSEHITSIRGKFIK